MKPGQDSLSSLLLAIYVPVQRCANRALRTVSGWAAENICDNEVRFYGIREYVISKRSFWTTGPLTMKGLRSSETSRVDHRTLHRHILQHRQESLKSHTGGSTA